MIAQSESSILITGGAGFIGSNLAHRLLSQGRRVRIFDNLSRAGVEQNLDWLRCTHGAGLQFSYGDVTDFNAVEEAVSRASQVYHLAAQVAVTTSLDDPVADFQVNAQGTLNVLEAIRNSKTRPPLLYTSTNKVYGALEDLELTETAKRYVVKAGRESVDESRRLDFHSPYGCSKGAAEQYVLDYSRSFGLCAIVFRMSCIYGPRQFGTEDQGWLAHFLLRALRGKPLTVYGTGRQVRDVLCVHDLVNAFLLAEQHRDVLSGMAFNIGGGRENTISLLELLERLPVAPEAVRFLDWRVGDQRYYVSNIDRFSARTGWTPVINIGDGLNLLHAWLSDVSRSAAAAVHPEVLA